MFRYTGKIYLTMAFLMPLVQVIFNYFFDRKNYSSTKEMLNSYLSFIPVVLVAGLFFALGMFSVIHFTKEIANISIRKLILNILAVFSCISIFSSLGIVPFPYILPCLLTFTASIWYFELEVENQPELTDIDHLVE